MESRKKRKKKKKKGEERSRRKKKERRRRKMKMALKKLLGCLFWSKKMMKKKKAEVGGDFWASAMLVSLEDRRNFCPANAECSKLCESFYDRIPSTVPRLGKQEREKKGKWRGGKNID